MNWIGVDERLPDVEPNTDGKPCAVIGESGNIYREDPDWLCDIPIGEVVEVEHRVSYELEQDPVFAAIQWDEINGDVGNYETFDTKEEAEKVAAHCKAMIEAQEQKKWK